MSSKLYLDDQWLEISPQDVDDILAKYKSAPSSAGHQDKNNTKVSIF